jgi:hypothetical protein
MIFFEISSQQEYADNIMIGMPTVASNILDLPNMGQSIGSCVIKDLQLQRHFLAQMVSLIDLLTCNGLCFKFSCNISPEVCLKVKISVSCFHLWKPQNDYFKGF